MRAKRLGQGFFARLRNQLSESLADLWQTPISSLMTIAVLGVSLSLPASFHLMLKNAQSVGNNWDAPSQITLFLQKDRSEQQNRQFADEVQKLAGVEQVKFISRQQALDEFRSRSGLEDVLSYLDENPLPDVLVVSPDGAHQSPAQAKILLQQLLTNQSEVAEGKLDTEWLQRLYGILAVVQRIIIIVEVLLMLTLLLIVASSMRLSILARRDEIEVLKLVGASDPFIMLPFLCSGFWYGVIGGLVAWVLTNMATVAVASQVSDLAALYGSQYYVQGLDFGETLWLVGCGIILSLIASLFAVHHHIQRIEPQ